MNVIGTLFLFGAVGAAPILAFFKVRWGPYLGAALLASGLLPAAYVLLARVLFGIHMGESESRVIALSLFYLAVPGAMLMSLCAGAIRAGWDR